MRRRQIARIDCPIGDPALGKHPQAIAVGVAAGVSETNQRKSRHDRRTRDDRDRGRAADRGGADQGLSRRGGQQRRVVFHRSGRGPCAAGRERRGEIDAGQDDLRPRQARQRADDAARRALCAAQAQRGAQPGRGDGVPAFQPVRGAERGRERGAGHGEPAEDGRTGRSASARYPRNTGCRWTRTGWWAT